MDEGPDAPIEAGDSAEEVHFGKEPVGLAVGDRAAIQVFVVAGEIFAEKAATLETGGEDGEVAFEAAPFCEVVGDVEGGGRGRGVFVVDEFDGFDGGRACGAGCVRLNDDVAAQEIAVAEDELYDWC